MEVEYYTSPPPHETKTISMRFVGRCLVGVVREIVQPAHVSVVTSRDGAKGRAGRVAAGGLTTIHTRLSVYAL